MVQRPAHPAGLTERRAGRMGYPVAILEETLHGQILPGEEWQLLANLIGPLFYEKKTCSEKDMGEARLTIELVPSSSWYTNVRSHLPPEEWDLIRRAVYRRAKYRCEICGGRGAPHPVECHEVWSYDDARKVQRLERMIALCPACHRVKHIGLASIRGRYDEAIRHLAQVNDWPLDHANRYADAAFGVWMERSQSEWTVDLGSLTSEHYRRWISRQRGVDSAHVHTNPSVRRAERNQGFRSTDSHTPRHVASDLLPRLIPAFGRRRRRPSAARSRPADRQIQ